MRGKVNRPVTTRMKKGKNCPYYLSAKSHSLISVIAHLLVIVVVRRHLAEGVFGKRRRSSVCETGECISTRKR